jgi:hypothetical protein
METPTGGFCYYLVEPEDAQEKIVITITCNRIASVRIIRPSFDLVSR